MQGERWSPPRAQRNTEEIKIRNFPQKTREEWGTSSSVSSPKQVAETPYPRTKIKLALIDLDSVIQHLKRV